jgi:signal peptidase
MTLNRIGLALTLAILGAWFVLLRPMALGGPTSYLFVSGTSMLPTLETGDLVIAQSASTYEVGDVVAYHVPDGQPGAGALVIHRIVGGSANGFLIQGDNRDQPDDWHPASDDIVGRLWVRIPGAGTAIAFIKQPGVLAPLAAGLAVTFVLLGGGRREKGVRPTSSVTSRG